MSTQETVTRVIVEMLGVPEADVKPDARMAEDLGADSLDCVEILLAIEEDLDIELNDDECAQCKTVGDWVAMVERRVAA